MTDDPRAGDSWREAAVQYHRDRGDRPLVVEIEPERLEFLRRLMDDDIPLDRAWRELNDPGTRPTPQATIEAIMYCVRARGLAALKEPANLERLSRCDAAAIAQLDRRLTKESV
jgi:hypothetical protein